MTNRGTIAADQGALRAALALGAAVSIVAKARRGAASATG